MTTISPPTIHYDQTDGAHAAPGDDMLTIRGPIRVVTFSERSFPPSRRIAIDLRYAMRPHPFRAEDKAGVICSPARDAILEIRRYTLRAGAVYMHSE